MNGPDFYVILNPASNRGGAARLRPVVERAFQRLGAPAEMVETGGRGHGEELARAAALAGRRAVVAIGGDGIVHEVAKRTVIRRWRRAELRGLAIYATAVLRVMGDLKAPRIRVSIDGAEIRNGGHAGNADCARLIRTPEHVGGSRSYSPRAAAAARRG